MVPKIKFSVPFELYYSLIVEVIISFGNTEFSAQVAWQENVSRLDRTFFFFSNWSSDVRVVMYLGRREKVSRVPSDFRFSLSDVLSRSPATMIYDDD